MQVIAGPPFESLGKKIKDTARVSGEAFDKIVGVMIVLIGVYFLYLAFH